MDWDVREWDVLAMADSFGDLLRRFRVAARLTQEALAEQRRVSPATIAAIEQGRRTAPRLSTVRLIAEALELPAADRELLARAADHGATVAQLVPADVGVEAARQTDNGGTDVSLVTAWPAAAITVVSPQFIGRRTEIASLTALMTRAEAGEPGVALVGGEAGVGKSRLVSEFAGQAASHGFRVLAGQWVELGAGGLPPPPP